MIDYINLCEVDNPFTYPGPLISIRANRVVRWRDLKGDKLDSTIKQWAANLGISPDQLHTYLTFLVVHAQLGNDLPPWEYFQQLCREGLLYAELAGCLRELQRRRLEQNWEQERRRPKAKHRRRLCR
jgi:hypothetical protein